MAETIEPISTPENGTDRSEALNSELKAIASDNQRGRPEIRDDDVAMQYDIDGLYEELEELKELHNTTTNEDEFEEIEDRMDSIEERISGLEEELEDRSAED